MTEQPSVAEVSQDVSVSCTLCNHEWVAMTLPLGIQDVIKAASKKCPQCGASGKHIKLMRTSGHDHDRG